MSMKDIDRKKVEAKLAAFRKDHLQAQANVHALSGAIQAMEALLKDDDADAGGGTAKGGDGKALAH